jgi:hypothetical protein
MNLLLRVVKYPEFENLSVLKKYTHFEFTGRLILPDGTIVSKIMCICRATKNRMSCYELLFYNKEYHGDCITHTHGSHDYSTVKEA